MEPLTASFVTRSAAETRALGAALGRVLARADFVALLGDLGAGKTEFARGVAEGCQVPAEEVASPTFALVHRYGGRIPLAHADLYRLDGEDDLYGTGYFELRDATDEALMVEWADRIPGAIAADALRVRLRAPGEGDRRDVDAAATGPASRRLLDRWRSELSSRRASSARPAGRRRNGGRGR
jgi:tRNA threonylcarbamoyladenosine biosynthesis protein TsaE